MDENVIQLSPLLKHYIGFCRWRFSNAANRTKISQQLFLKSVNYEIAFNCPHCSPIIAAALKCYLLKGCFEIVDGGNHNIPRLPFRLLSSGCHQFQLRLVEWFYIVLPRIWKSGLSTFRIITNQGQKAHQNLLFGL